MKRLETQRNLNSAVSSQHSQRKREEETEEGTIEGMQIKPGRGAELSSW